MIDARELQKEWVKSRKVWGEDPPNRPCALSQPLMMVVGPDGFVLPCPVHPEGHFLLPIGVVQVNERSDK